MAIPTLLVALQAQQLVQNAQSRSRAGQGKDRHLKRRPREEGRKRANEHTRSLKEHIAFFSLFLFFFLKAAVPFSSIFKWLPGKQSKGEWKG